MGNNGHLNEGMGAETILRREADTAGAGVLQSAFSLDSLRLICGMDRKPNMTL